MTESVTLSCPSKTAQKRAPTHIYYTLERLPAMRCSHCNIGIISATVALTAAMRLNFNEYKKLADKLVSQLVM